MDPTLSTAARLGWSLAEEHDRQLSTPFAGSLFQSTASPFRGIGVREGVEAFGVYAQRLIELGEARPHPYYADDYAKDLVVSQLSRLLGHELMPHLVMKKLVMGMLIPCCPAWTKGQPDQPSRIKRRKKINEIFQASQENYANAAGQRMAIAGFRMVGQSVDANGKSPFLECQPTGKDEVVQRLSFFLRTSSRHSSKTRASLASTACQLDLAAAWRGCQQESMRNANTLTDREQHRKTRASMAVAGWLASHGPEALGHEITKMDGQGLAEWPTMETSEPFEEAGKAFVLRALLRGQTTSIQGRWIRGTRKL